MKKIKELTKEYNLLLTEFDKLKKMKDELKSYYPDTKDLKNKNNKVKKELKKIFVGTIFLPGVSKIERIQHRYFLKLLKKLELTDKDKKLVYEIDLEPYEYKKVKGVEKLKNSNVEEQLKVYANSIAKITSSSQGTIAKLLGKKNLDFKGLMEEIKKALFYVASLIALLRKLMFKQKKYFALEGKEKRKTKSQKDLRERAKELRSIGIKGKKREINIEDIDAFFMQRFGRSYSELLGLFKDVKKICAPIKHFFGLKDHAVIFPLTGQLFNYYVAKGILQEMQRFENKKGPILLTLVTMAEIYHYSFDSNGHYETDYKKTRMIQEGLKKQIEKIIKKHKLESISVIDKFVLQRTIDQIRDQFKKYNVPLNRTTNVDEHQIIGRMVPFELINKSLSGKAIPLSHSKKNE